MKRFLIIFAICFGSLVATIGGVFGVKFLKGDFNEKIVQPESIYFENNIYEVEDDFYITIKTTTENVTKKQISLSFVDSKYSTHGANYYTDGVVIIPKQVFIDQPFKVELVKTNDAELNNIPWIKGGCSKIQAASENKLAQVVTAQINVDVPVYKTELVLMEGSGKVNAGNMKTVLKNLQANMVSDDDALVKIINESEPYFNISTGKTFYMAVNYYPVRSNFKYSKISSTNLLVQYYDQILEQASSLNYQEKIQQIKTFEQLFENQDNIINIDQIVALYNQILDIDTNYSVGSKEYSFQQYIKNLNDEFNKNTRYNTLQENPDSQLSTKYLNINKISGSNLYEVKATQNSNVSNKTVNLYSYAFTHSTIEDLIIQNAQDQNLQTILENHFNQQDQNNKDIEKQNGYISLIDVDVNNCEINGSVADFYVNKIHTIFANKNGINNENTSYLNVILNNQNLPDIDLQNKILNLGALIQKRSKNEWVNVSDVLFEGSQTVTYNGEVYHLPISNSLEYFNAYWQIYTDVTQSSELRLKLVYFKNTNPTSEQDIVVFDEGLYPKFSIKDNSLDSLIEWTSLNDLDLGIVNINGTSNGDISFNKQVDLNTLINIPNTNAYQSYKFFLYSDGSRDLTEIFDVLPAKTYNISGSQKNLYELNSSVLQLKGNACPDETINVIFATIKTNAHRQPILNENGTYQIVKYSAIQDTYTENLSALKIVFKNSISALTIDISKILDQKLVGIIEENSNNKVLKLAQNSEGLIGVNISRAGDADAINTAIQNNKIWIEAIYEGDNTNYISYSKTNPNYDFVIATKQLQQDTTVKFNICYAFDNITYYIPAKLTLESVNFSQFNIVKNTASKAQFAFKVGDEVVSSKDIEYILVSTKINGDGDNKTITREYKAKLKNRAQEQDIVLFDQTGKLLIQVIDFLDRVDDSNQAWELESSKPNLLTISEDKKGLVFIGSESNENTTLTLKLTQNSSLVQDSITFKVNSCGSVVEVLKAKDVELNLYDSSTYQAVYTTDHVNEYNFSNIDVVLNMPVKQEATTFSLEKIISFKYQVGQDDLYLKTTVYPDQETLDNLKSIGNNNLVSVDNPLSNFSVKSILAETIRLNFVYKFEEGLNLPNQNVQITIRQNASIKDLKIEYKTSQDQTQLVAKQQDIYNIYAGVNYTLTITPDNLTNLYYFIKNGDSVQNLSQLINGRSNSNISSITKNVINLRFYDNITGEFTIVITNKDSEQIAFGDLSYEIKINVNQNYIAKQNFTTTLENGKDVAEIPLKEVLSRVVADYGEEKEIFTIYYNSGSSSVNVEKVTQEIEGKLGYELDYSDGSIKLTFTKINFETTNSLVVNFKIGIKVLDTTYYLHDTNISVTILQDNFKNQTNVLTNYNGQKAIVLSQGSNYSEDILKGYFDKTESIEVDAGFETYYVRNDSDNKTISMQNSSLFENTGYYLSYTNNVVTTKYLIVLCRLPFPFVNFKEYNISTKQYDTISYENLDAYKLFVDQSQDLKEYYSQNGLGKFKANDTNDYNLFKGGDSIFDSSLILNESSQPTISIIEKDLQVSKIAQISGNTTDGYVLQNKGTGSDDIWVKVTFGFKQDSYNYDVSVLVNMDKNQELFVDYPYDNAGEMKSDYNDDFMLQDTVTFNEKSMEYLSFDINGNAEIEFLQKGITRLIAKKDGDIQENYSDYLITVEKVTYLYGEEWHTASNNGNFVSINSTKATITNYQGAKAVRVKFKLSTAGGAENYYYVSVNEIYEPALYRYDTNNVSGKKITQIDNISVNFGEKIAIGSYNSVVTYGYMFAGTNVSYNNKLFARIIDNSNNVYDYIRDANDKITGFKENDFVTYESNIFKIKSLPIGANFDLQIYTIYGVLATVTVKVNPSCTFTLNKSIINNSNIVYDNTTGEIKGLITVTDHSKESSSLTIKSFSIPEGYENGFIEAVEVKEEPNYQVNSLNSNASQTIDLIATVTLCEYGDKVYQITIPSIKISPRITSNYPDMENYFYYDGDDNKENGKQSVSENNGTITFGSTTIASLFTDNHYNLITSSDDSNYSYGVVNSLVSSDNDFELYYTSEYQTEKKIIELTQTDDNITINVGAVVGTQTVTKYITFYVQKGDNILCSAIARFDISPQYSLTFGYPRVFDIDNNLINLTTEYVQVGGRINLTGAGPLSQGKQRISVKKSDGSSATSFTFKVYKGITLLYDSNSDKFLNNGKKYLTISDKTITFASQGHLAQGEIVDISGTYIIEIYPDNTTECYGTYNVEAINSNPFGVSEILINNLYVGYGYNENKSDIFNYADVEITIPKIDSLSLGDEISLTLIGSGIDDIALSNPFTTDAKYYYKSGSKVRALLNLDKIDTLNVYDLSIVLKHDTKLPEGISLESKSYLITPRMTLTYKNLTNTYFVPYNIYKNLIASDIAPILQESDIELQNLSSQNPKTSNIDLIVKLQSNEVINSTSLQNNDTLAKKTINYLYDLNLNYTPIGAYTYGNKNYTNIDLVITAGSEEISLIDTFGLKDYLNNVIWYNNLSTDRINLSLNTPNGTINSLLITPVEVNKMYTDFKIKALGADNDGTVQTVTLTWKIGSYTATQTFNILVLPGVIAEFKNGDDTANSEDSQYKLTNLLNGRVFASTSITNFAHIFKENDASKQNIVMDMNFRVTGTGSSWLTLELKNNELIFKTLKDSMPEFGNKYIQIEFYNQYNLSYTFYITLVAKLTVDSINIGSASGGTVYENENLNVYNPQAENSSLTGGIQVNLIDSSTGVKSSQSIVILSAEYYVNGSNKTGVFKELSNQSKKTYLTSNWLTSDDWGSKTYLPGELRLTIAPTGSTTGETYTFNVSMTILKRYSAKITEENLYIRDGDQIPYAYLVEVIDNKQSKTLGAPVMSHSLAIQVTENNDILKYSDEIKINVEDFEQIDDILGTDLSESTYKDHINEFNTKLQEYGILWSGKDDDTNFTGYVANLTVTLKHKATGETLQSSIIGKINKNSEEDYYYIVFERKLNSIFQNTGIDFSSFDVTIGTQNPSSLKNVKTLASTIPFDNDNNDQTENATANITLGIKSSINVYISSNTSNQSIYYKTDSNVINSITLNSENKNGVYDLEGYGSYELISGYYTIDGSSLVIDENRNIANIYINGMNQTTVKSIKNISNVGISGASWTESYTATLKADSLNEGTFDNQDIYYAQVSFGSDLLVDYVSDNQDPYPDSKKASDYYENLATNKLNITTKYTGVDTSKAYGTSYISTIFTEFGNSLNEEGKIGNSGYDIDLKDWSKNLILKTGFGISNMLASGEDKTFYGSNNGSNNIKYLSFKIGNVKSLSNANVTSSLVEINTNNELKLKEGFIPTDYYIQVDVYCKYLKENGADSNECLIGSVLLNFMQKTVINSCTSQDANIIIDVSSLNISANETSTVTLGTLQVEKTIQNNILKNIYFDIQNMNTAFISGNLYSLNIKTGENSSSYFIEFSEAMLLINEEINLAFSDSNYRIDNISRIIFDNFKEDNLILKNGDNTLDLTLVTDKSDTKKITSITSSECFSDTSITSCNLIYKKSDTEEIIIKSNIAVPQVTETD